MFSCFHLVSHDIGEGNRGALGGGGGGLKPAEPPAGYRPVQSLADVVPKRLYKLYGVLA